MLLSNHRTVLGALTNRASLYVEKPASDTSSSGFQVGELSASSAYT